MIKLIKYKKKILGLIISHKQSKNKVNFYTPNSFTQQVGFISHNKVLILNLTHIQNS